VHFLLVLIGLFARCYGAGASSKNRLLIGVLHVGGFFGSVSASPPPIIFSRIVRPVMLYNFVADSFHTKKLVADLLQAKRLFWIFEPLWRLRGDVRCSSLYR